MEGKVYCSSCGAGCDAGNAYCSVCGMSTENKPMFSYAHTAESHCTGCGAKIGPREIYCGACGIECVAYTPEIPKSTAFPASFSQIKNTLSDSGALSEQFSDVADNVRKAVPQHVEFVKERSVWAPALVFALAAVGVGLIISFLLDMAASSAIQELVEGVVRDQLGSMVAAQVGAMLEDAGIGLGAVSVWLMTCLGGLGVSVKGSMLGQSGSINASIALGFICFTIVPALALLIARQVQKAFISAKHPDKQPRVLDGVVGALMFALINLLLSFFPSNLGNKLSQVLTYQASYAEISINVSALSWNVFFFSFIIALLFAIPNIRSLTESLRAKQGLLPTALAGATGYIWRVLAAGLVVIITTLFYSVILAGSQSSVSATDMLDMLGGEDTALGLLFFLLLLPNLAITGMSYLAGGSMAVKADGTAPMDILDLGSLGEMQASISALNINAEDIGLHKELGSGSGYLLLLAGIFVAVMAFYKFLYEEERFFEKAAVMIAFSAGLMWAVGACASLSLKMKASSAGEVINGSVMMTPISAGGLIMVMVLLAAACAVIYCARKVPSFNAILLKALMPVWPYVFVAVTTLLHCHFLVEKIKSM